MNTYETDWMRIRFPSPWRIQTTRDKIIFTPLSRTAGAQCEVICLMVGGEEPTDKDLESYIASFSTELAAKERISLGSLNGFQITLPDNETRLFMRRDRFIVIIVIRTDVDEHGFEQEAIEMIRQIEFKEAEQGTPPNRP